MRKADKNEYVTLKDKVHIPGTDIILEKGDKVRFSEMVDWASKIDMGDEYLFSTKEGTIHVTKKPDGSFYGQTNEFDMTFPTNQDLNDAVEANGWKFIGVE